MVSLLHHYIGTGLEMLHERSGRKFLLEGIDNNSFYESGYNYSLSFWKPKPIMLPLEALTENGDLEKLNEEFHLDFFYDKVGGGAIACNTDDFLAVNVLAEPFEVIQWLLNKHYWIGDQSLFGTEIIDKRTLYNKY